MNSVVAQLREIEENLDSAVCDAFAEEAIPALSTAEIAEVLAVTGRIQRRLEGVQIEATAQVSERSGAMRDDKMTVAYGCSRPADLVRMLTGADSRQATQLVKAAGRVRRERSFTEGSFLPARYQALREAVLAGDLGLAGLIAATDPIERSARRISDEARIAADRQLAHFARGVDPDAAEADAPRPLPYPEDLRVLSRVLVAYIDPDGAEPIDDIAMRGRSFTIGRVGNDGLTHVRGGLLPEVAGQLGLLLDSLLNPRVDGAENLDRTGVRFEPSEDAATDDSAAAGLAAEDPRTRTQKQHDALASILNTAARTDLFPHLGGAAPTLVVATTAEDYARGAGWAQVASTGDLVPQRVAVQTACAGGIQRVLFDDNGRIVSIGTTARLFNALQRRAIALRDGGCIVPGFTISATWCEVHHVDEHADGGPTHTDNGVLLCWFHHRTLHLTEWVIRMNRGIPEVRGPAWWDPHQQWHRTRSPHRRRSVPG
ncbi:DUF222 domain-containing protein [Microbacterium sp.]|uniref:HNH endonuclease signature motif containing protein n=1 Tax=Microbacterium sp. TaxID=51671 RepID=UPI003A91F97E